MRGLLVAVATLAAACGVPGDPHADVAHFDLGCAHADATCADCHPSDQPLGKVDADCASCHADDRPADHGEELVDCASCHADACAFDDVDRVHPEAYALPALHGADAKLSPSTPGDCRTCHGAELQGATLPSGWTTVGCDGCHAEQGHPDWRTDCTFCHGGEGGDTLGAPPRDLDGTTDPAAVSFRAHQVHVAPGDHPTWDCATCHGVVHADVLDPTHVWDATPGTSELLFTGLAAGLTWDGATCAGSRCHGDGVVAGTVHDGNTALDCDACHGTTEARRAELSEVHDQHLADPNVTCADCHAATVDAAGVVVGPEAHVDGLLEVAFAEPAMSRPGGTCEGTCHGVVHHDGVAGHPPGYDAPEAHGVDANLQVSACGSCHGADLTGQGATPGCDDCHAAGGHADWRTDCTYCHGGEAGDTEGAPPQDLDGAVDPDQLSFRAHRAHVDPGDHPDWGCESCHVVATDVLSPGHAVDRTPGVAEVDFTAGLAAVARWDGATCADVACHGDGRVPGTVRADTPPLDCDGCHGTSPGAWDALSEVHAHHLASDPSITCADCHGDVDAGGAIAVPTEHVDGVVETDLPAGMTTPSGPGSCTGSCHGVDHFDGSAGHPRGYEVAFRHGVDANLQASDCRTCHGADLRGGRFAPGCDDCHAAGGHDDWREDCTYCHGGADGDTLGAPPEDLDDATSGDSLSFRAHRSHVGPGDHPTWDCATCHAVATDVLSPGHAFDATPGRAELVFDDLAAGLVWDPATKTCAGSRCHGDGVTPGTVRDDGTPLSCDGCHATTRPTWGRLSAVHGDHLLADPTIACADCHAGTVDASLAVVGPGSHVDGDLDVAFRVATMSRPEDGGLTCSGTCHGVDHWEGNVGHRPGYAAADQHGLEANLQVLDCRDCHGADLRGGPTAQGCDSCHAASGHAGWRTDCTYCHGGDGGDATGVPPEDIDGETDPTKLAFQAHRTHVAPGDHPTWGCATCHTVVADVLTPGHAFDATPGVGEAAFSGLAAGTTWDPVTSTCAGSRCHGDGKVPGDVVDGSAPMTCDGCHGTTAARWEDLSPLHYGHLVGDPTVACADCHAGVIDAQGRIVDPARHVDGTLQVALSTPTITMPSGPASCDGTCHGVAHFDGVAGHPAGYDAPDQHGLDANLQVSDCTDCHGADLRGGPSAQGCDTCHAANGHAGWRTDCTYCHGGEDGDTVGLPPQDVDGTTDPLATSFVAHGAHLAPGDHAPLACTSCHRVVTDVLTPLHTRDATRGRAEVDFALGLGAGGTYAAKTCTVSCHGDGVTDGTVTDAATSLTCDGCHGTSPSRWFELSPVHAEHLDVDPTVSCADCHGDVDAAGVITDAARHVDGDVDTRLPAGMTAPDGPGSCTGACHGVDHFDGSAGHPAGYDAPERHGVDANLQASDCRACHGADLKGGTFAQGCDTCHASSGHAGWRTDCTYCHGGADGDVLGAPPQDLDGATSGASLSFQAHQSHVGSGDHPTWDCATCHTVATDVLSPGHAFDATAGRAEVVFSELAAGLTWNPSTKTCAGSDCHGNGVTPGTVKDGATPLTCDGCHATTSARWGQLSKVHGDHLLADPTIACADCHAGTVDASLAVVGPERHVDGDLDVAFRVATMTRPGGGLTCTGGCHGVDHWQGNVGHRPGYAAADQHGLEANLQVLDCRDCHGADLKGGPTAQGCDSCHAASGHAGWRTDCTYCHGGDGGDTRGVPPEDVDGTSDPAGITFRAHRTHVAPGDHPTWDCATCHTVVTDVLSAGHAFDTTPGVAEARFSGLAAGTTWDATRSTCTGSRCHGDGTTPVKVVDSVTPLTCDGCHGTTTTRWDDLSGIHSDHLRGDPSIRCSDCHQGVIDATGAITGDALHVDGTVEVGLPAGMTAPSGPLSCTGACHGVDHFAGAGGHPVGYARPEVHGVDANLQVSDCGTCHGADLRGGTAQGCDSCHAAAGDPDWRTDCTFCHGGAQGDLRGAPPEDLDDTVDPDLVSFEAHQDHLAAGDHPAWDCALCHGTVVRDVLDPGHARDATKGTAEVRFTGLAAGATWNRTTSTCGNVYCHGDGVTSGSSVDNHRQAGCDDCHATSSGLWDELSPVHGDHLAGDPTIACSDCHAATVDDLGTIVGPDRHVDGALDVAFAAAGMTQPSGPGSCTGRCHGVDHYDGKAGHPAGYAAPEVHGLEANLQVLDCRACHGADLKGGPTAQGCDSCHASSGHAGWRTDCTYCHGGDGGDALGAPPEDIDDTTDPAKLTFSAHQAHVAQGDHPTWTCATCHTTATSVLSSGHAFDATPGRAETSFTGLAAGLLWDPATKTCASSRCHGDGVTPGTAHDGTASLSCDGCHATSTAKLGQLSSLHASHVTRDPTIQCRDCHATVVGAANAIVGPALHVDGTVESTVPAGMTRPSGPLSCTGSCHGASHQQGVVGHPPGFDAPDRHGREANLQLSDCRTCHGADLKGSQWAPSCDGCHAAGGHAGWRTDCTYCHGGDQGDTRGAPPEDLDDTSTPSAISFQAHRAHTTPGGDHPDWGCAACHTVATDVLSLGHAFDATKGEAEVDFSRGTSPLASWNGTTCADSWCHGNGQVEGTVADGLAPLGCDGCHGTSSSTWADLSPIHTKHLGVDPTIACTDCHAATVDRTGVVVGPDAHVDGAADLVFAATGMSAAGGPLACTGSCHGVKHADGIVGHPPGYAAADVHGLEANLQVTDCRDCHGADLKGVGMTPGCDSCHASNGHAGWRTDCTYCHGGANGDTKGVPPQDVDNNANIATISFKAHKEHVAAGGHPTWTCATCHTMATDVLSLGHAFDATPGRAEVAFAGIAAGSTWTSSTSTCTTRCHGDGTKSGTVADGRALLTCDGCHGTSSAKWSTMSSIHADHLAGDPTIRCSDCHAGVVSSANAITAPAQHVDGDLDVLLAVATMSQPSGVTSCTGSCHGVDHVAGTVGHPPGYDAPEVHGLDANLQVKDCRKCHGADLQGGTLAPGCDACHTASGHPDWRSDCTYCHGGTSGDTAGSPPQDLDDQSDPTRISFVTHRVHAASSTHPPYGCATCHGATSGTYRDALTDLGHAFDVSPAVAEVAFTGIAGTTATWTGSTLTCSNVYCHGTGRTPGSATDKLAALTCRSCHPDKTSPETAISRMSGEHHKHVWDKKFACSECHASVTNGSQAIVGPALHVDGTKQVALDPANGLVKRSNTQCTGSCHGVSHTSDRW